MNLSEIQTETPPLKNEAPRQIFRALPEPGHVLLTLDNTALENYTVCPTKGYHYLIRNREAQAKNSALVFGGAIHVGLEALLRNEGLDAAKDKATAFYSENPPPLNDYRTLANVHIILTEYQKRSAFPDYQWEILSDSLGPIIERAFELPLGVIEYDAEIPGFGHITHVHVAWSGRIDAVATSNGVPRIVDHKTTSIDTEGFFQDFQLSNQVLGYIWAGRQLWPDLDLLGFCLNAIRLKRTAGTQPITEKGPRGGEAPLGFMRHYYDYTHERVVWWEENVLAIISDFLHCLSRDYFPSHTKSCIGKYGQCPYHLVCVANTAQVREAILNSTAYKTVTWNPTHNR